MEHQCNGEDKSIMKSGLFNNCKFV